MMDEVVITGFGSQKNQTSVVLLFLSVKKI